MIVVDIFSNGWGHVSHWNIALLEDSDDEDLSAVETVTKIPLSVTKPAAETEVANPPSPEVLEVEPPPKPVPDRLHCLADARVR